MKRAVVFSAPRVVYADPSSEAGNESRVRRTLKLLWNQEVKETIRFLPRSSLCHLCPKRGNEIFFGAKPFAMWRLVRHQWIVYSRRESLRERSRTRTARTYPGRAFLSFGHMTKNSGTPSKHRPCFWTPNYARNMSKFTARLTKRKKPYSRHSENNPIPRNRSRMK